VLFFPPQSSGVYFFLKKFITGFIAIGEIIVNIGTNKCINVEEGVDFNIG
jgi:hypothetical protein